jgi:nitrate/nitrite-specific signal transduction histidine kinase
MDHAGEFSWATRVGVQMNEVTGEFILSISDNGREITDHEKMGQRTLGLLGMRERAHLIKAHSESTISTYRGRILEKMGMRTNAELTHYAIQHRLVE